MTNHLLRDSIYSLKALRAQLECLEVSQSSQFNKISMFLIYGAKKWMSNLTKWWLVYSPLVFSWASKRLLPRKDCTNSFSAEREHFGDCMNLLRLGDFRDQASTSHYLVLFTYPFSFCCCCWMIPNTRLSSRN